MGSNADEELEYEGEGLPLRGLMERTERPEDFFQSRLRPPSFDEYIGQGQVKKSLSIAISAAKKREESLDHLLFYGPPGLGKTTLAAIVAHEMNVAFKATSGPVLERPGDLAAVLSSLDSGDVLFIDEIHRLNRSVEEILYPAMEDGFIDIIVGQGPAARSVKLELQPFTLIGATTRAGLLTAPLRDRFGIIERLEFYSDDELEQIVLRSAALLPVEIESLGAREISKRSRGTPRIANRLLRRARDFAQEFNDSVVSRDVSDQALSLLSIDERGFDKMDRALLLTIIDKFDGGPVGVETLAAALNEDKDTIEDVYEPYLLQQGMLRRTPRGREASPEAFRYFRRSPGAQS